MSEDTFVTDVYKRQALGCLFVFGIAPVGIGGLWTKGIGQKREKTVSYTHLDVYKRQAV